MPHANLALPKAVAFLCTVSQAFQRSQILIAARVPLQDGSRFPYIQRMESVRLYSFTRSFLTLSIHTCIHTNTLAFAFQLIPEV